MERAKGYGGFGQAVLDFILSLGRINAIEIYLEYHEESSICIIYPCDYRIFCINGKLFE